jgi:hypothetical protein
LVIGQLPDESLLRGVRQILISYGQQICLGCGAIINVFDKGTVLVQGKLNPQCKEESLRMLKQVLPSDTRWGV